MQLSCARAICSLQMGAKIVGAVLSVLYAARNGLMDDEVSGQYNRGVIIERQERQWE